jgi:hypothetical protein
MKRNGFQRRTIYGVTIVAILAVAGGFAIASSFVFAPTATQGQNGYSVQTGSTIWTFESAAATLDPVSTCVKAVSATLSPPGPTPTSVLSDYIPSTASGACTVTDFAEEFNFSASVVTASTADSFTVFSYTAASSAACTSAPVASVDNATVATMGGEPTPATPLNFSLWVDFGPAPVDICGVSIAVSGS